MAHEIAYWYYMVTVLKQSVVCEILIVLQRLACIKAGRTRVYIWCSFGGVRGTRVIMTY